VRRLWILRRGFLIISLNGSTGRAPKELPDGWRVWIDRLPVKRKAGPPTRIPAQWERGHQRNSGATSASNHHWIDFLLVALTPKRASSEAQSHPNNGPAVLLGTAPFSGSCRTMKYYLELSYPIATNSQNTADAIIRRAIGIQAAGSGVGYNRSIGAIARATRAGISQPAKLPSRCATCNKTPAFSKFRGSSSSKSKQSMMMMMMMMTTQIKASFPPPLTYPKRPSCVSGEETGHHPHQLLLCSKGGIAPPVYRIGDTGHGCQKVIALSRPGDDVVDDNDDDQGLPEPALGDLWYGGWFGKCRPRYSDFDPVDRDAKPRNHTSPGWPNCAYGNVSIGHASAIGSFRPNRKSGVTGFEREGRKLRSR
jgi:hypothetical protein